jgi:predicted nuclease with TOPRIM domain
MLTKSDLSAIQKMFDVSKKETNQRFEEMNEKFIGIDKRFEEMDKKFTGKFDSLDKKFEGKFDKLSDQLQKNTEELIELITGGFNSFEERIVYIEEKVFSAN